MQRERERVRERERDRVREREREREGDNNKMRVDRIFVKLEREKKQLTDIEKTFKLRLCGAI